MNDELPPPQGLSLQKAGEELTASEPTKTEQLTVTGTVPPDFDPSAYEKEEGFNFQEGNTKTGVQPTVEDQVKQAESQAVNAATSEALSEDVLIEYVLQLLDKAINKSKGNKFAAVGFQFSDLEIVFRVVGLVKKRSHLLNLLTNQVHARDVSLSQNSAVLVQMLQNQIVFLNALSTHVNSSLEAVKANVNDINQVLELSNQIKQLSNLFLGSPDEESKS